MKFSSPYLIRLLHFFKTFPPLGGLRKFLVWFGFCPLRNKSISVIFSSTKYVFFSCIFNLAELPMLFKAPHLRSCKSIKSCVSWIYSRRQHRHKAETDWKAQSYCAWGQSIMVARSEGSLSVRVRAEPIGSSNSCGSNKVFCTLRNQIFN